MSVNNSEPDTILIVDDNPANLGVLFEFLTNSGFKVLVSRDGADAIEKLEFAHPDLILLDVLMPGIDGFETCRRLKASPSTQDIPVIFMTALSETVDKVRGLSLGAVDYITKPLQHEEVLARITVHLQLRALTKKLQEQNQRLEEEISKRKIVETELAQRALDLERSNADLQQFAYVASHDLQEPLRMVASYVQLLARRYKGKLDADADEFIGYAVDGVKRMQVLINDLLAFSRVGTRGQSPELTDCEIILQQVLSNLQLAIEDTGAVISHDPLPTLVADSSQLIQLFQNLIGNAIKFQSDNSPSIHVSATPSTNEWLFSVRDNGIGISPEYAERIFIIFQRLHTRAEYPGTGIGLAICKKIVERHGGKIWVEPNSPAGSVFYFTLPAIDSTREGS